MSTLRKLTSVIGLSLMMAACASTPTEQQQYSSIHTEQKEAAPKKTKEQQTKEELSTNITFPPTIDIAYADVSGNVDQHIGANVRWGGEVIESTKIDESTVRMTVFGLPLSNEGRPIKQAKLDENYGRFIIELKADSAKNVNFKGRYVTMFGDITSQLAVTNGTLEKAIPVVNAEELVDWNTVDQIRTYAKNLRAYHARSYAYYSPFYYRPYYGKGFFGHRGGHFSFSYSKKFYGFGHRGFRRH